jgi:RNA polymerase sigma factor (sigma-70 family)
MRQSRTVTDVAKFRTTRWSLIAAAGGSTADRRAALHELCELYWPPVYGFVRRSGRAAPDALDLTQAFFARILEHNDLATADPQRGRFRSWLLGALRHFLANEWHRQRAQKRGGGMTPLSIDAIAAEGRYVHELADTLTPDRLYERRWALTLLGHVIDQLGDECAASGQAERFDRLKGFLVGGEPSYEELAAELGEAAGTLRVAVHRLRRRYRDLLRARIADTVERSEEVDEEIRYLLGVLS